MPMQACKASQAGNHPRQPCRHTACTEGSRHGSSRVLSTLKPECGQGVAVAFWLTTARCNGTCNTESVARLLGTCAGAAPSTCASAHYSISQLQETLALQTPPPSLASSCQCAPHVVNIVPNVVGQQPGQNKRVGHTHAAAPPSEEAPRWDLPGQHAPNLHHGTVPSRW